MREIRSATELNRWLAAATRSCVEAGLLVLLMCMVIPFASSADKRPIYNIAHMVNSIQELQDYLDRGANAVEVDIAFNRNGTIKGIYHGYPCDCYRVCDERERFSKYLNYIRDFTDPNHRSFQKNLALLLLDLKLDEVSRSQKYVAGEEIAKNLITHLWNNNDKGEPRINVLVSIGHTTDSDVIKGVQDTFEKSNRGRSLSRIGFDVGLNDDLSDIRRMWSKLDMKANRWQGDGISNCFRPLKDDSRLKNAIRIRDAETGFIEKVYDWTVDLTANMRSSLRSGVDGLLTNFPERVHAVLQEKEFRDRFRLATKDDNPFSRVIVSTDGFSLRQPVLDGMISSVREVAVALLGYMWDFYKLRLQKPSTLFPLIQEFFSRAMPALRQYRSSTREISTETAVVEQ